MEESLHPDDARTAALHRGAETSRTRLVVTFREVNGYYWTGYAPATGDSRPLSTTSGYQQIMPADAVPPDLWPPASVPHYRCTWWLENCWPCATPLATPDYPLTPPKYTYIKLFSSRSLHINYSSYLWYFANVFAWLLRFWTEFDYLLMHGQRVSKWIFYVHDQAPI